MPFKRTPQKFNAAINALTIGTGDNAVTIGGAAVLPLYSFDGDLVNAPKVGIEFTDLGLEGECKGIVDFYAGAATIAEIAAKAETVPGADFVSLRLDGADPNGHNKSVEECVEIAVAVANAISKPLVIQGCKNNEKDAELFEKIAAALEGKNVLFLAAKEENNKQVGASVGLAYGQKVGAESAVDINLAKQLNVLLTQLGVKAENIAMNLGTAAAGYGFEYVASTMDRVKAAALGQNDNMLQMPVVTPVAGDAWSVKEAMVDEADYPEWGPVEERGIKMEITTAAACLACGSDAVILKHPRSVAAISAMIAAIK